MLKSFRFEEPISKEEYQEKASKLKDEMSSLQLEIKNQGLPVVVIFEGPSAAGKGQTISHTILSLDPRFFRTYSVAKPNDLE